MGRKTKTKQQASAPDTAPAQETKQQQKQTSKDASQVQVIEAMPGFFGHVVAPGTTLTWENEHEQLALQLHTASLGAEVVEGRSTLLVTAKETTTALCTLQPKFAEQWNLSHMFTPFDGPVVFENKGVNAIHVSGMVDVEDEDDDDDCCGGGNHHHHDDEEEEEEEFDLDDEDDEDDDENNGLAIFGGLDDDSSSDEEEDEEEADKDRFEVLEERMHDVEEAKEPASKAKSPVKETKAPAEKTTPTKSTESKKSPAKKTDDAATKKQNAPKEDAKAAGKKRAAADETAAAAKKAKTVRDYKGVKIEEHTVGKGQPVQRGKKVAILYRGCLQNGKQFDANQNRKKPFTFRHGLGDVIKGMDIGIEGMRAGGKRTITIPSNLGYGRQGAPPAIPRNATLVFDIELL